MYAKVMRSQFYFYEPGNRTQWHRLLRRTLLRFEFCAALQILRNHSLIFVRKNFTRCLTNRKYNKKKQAKNYTSEDPFMLIKDKNLFVLINGCSKELKMQAAIKFSRR